MGTSAGCYIGSPQDVIFQSPKGVRRGHPQDIGRDVPCSDIEDHMETSIGRLLGKSTGRPRDVILPSALSLFHTLR